MTRCSSCGEKKAEDDLWCLSCGDADDRVIWGMAARTPSLTILVLALSGFSIYRFWLLGWDALPGNLRLIAFIGGGLGVAGIIFGPLWTFGVRSRKAALILLIVSTVALIFQFVVSGLV